MVADRKQPSANGLREALAPWYDHSAAWLVLLCLVLTAFSAITSFATRRSHRRPGREADRRRRGAFRHFGHSARRRARSPEARAPARLGVPCLGDHAPVRRDASGPRHALDRAAGRAGGDEPAGVRLLPLRRHGRGRLPDDQPRSRLRPAVLARDDAGRRSASGACSGSRCRTALRPDLLPARSSWTVGLDAVIGVLAAMLLLRRSDWRHWPGHVAFALALGALVGARLLEAHAATRGHASVFAAPLHLAAISALRHRGALRLPAHRAACAADGRIGARLSVRAAHALCRADARGLCAADTALGQLRRARRAHRLGRLHRSRPAVRAPGDRDGPRASRSRPASRRARPRRASTP